MPNLYFYPFPVLTTSRLQLRSLKTEDVQEVFELRSHPANNKYLNRKDTTDIQQARDFINKMLKGIYDNQWLYWGITIKGQDKLIGTICLWNFKEKPFRAEVGYELHHNFQGQGYMHEALVVVLEYAFEKLKVSSVEASTHQENLPSIRLLEKNNFIFKGPIDEKMSKYTLSSKL